METQSQHLQLVFLTSTVTAAWGVGWSFTATSSVPQRRQPRLVSKPLRLQLAVTDS